ncbi:MAG: hypothetical protein WCY11_04950, partial [Novosphingobium sp.]
MTQRLFRDRTISLNTSLAGKARRGLRAKWPWLAGLGMGLSSVPMIFTATPGDIGEKLVATSVRPAQAAVPAIQADCSASPAGLQADLSAVARSFNGRVGIAVAKAGCDWVAGE